MTGIYLELVNKLEKIFGKFDQEHRRFEATTNSKISRDLGYSDAQFSRLINETATDKEYQRAIQNVDRILKIHQLEKQVESGNANGWSVKLRTWFILSIVFFLMFAGMLIAYLTLLNDNEESSVDASRDYTLEWTFENYFINPYSKLDDLPADCNYPCYKYQGQWALEKNYKLPFFRERNGFHYLATEAKLYARCMAENNDGGKTVEGYEYQRHEIWYDVKEWPMDSFVTESGIANKRYENLNFEDDESFIKVANVHTFFRNEFSLGDSLIVRKGKVIGRDLELLDRETMLGHIKDNNQLKQIETQINRIVEKRLQDFSVPINCLDIPLIRQDVADIADGDRMSYSCQMTTSRFPIEYTKTYILVDQYIKNDCVQD